MSLRRQSGSLERLRTTGRRQRSQIPERGINRIRVGSQLTLDGNNTFVEDSTALGSNSALTGLANFAGALDLESGASVSTGALANSGALYLDYSDRGRRLEPLLAPVAGSCAGPLMAQGGAR